MDNPFTVDTDDSIVKEVPTISRLLNRKKFSSKESTKTKTRTLSKAVIPNRSKTALTQTRNSKVIEIPVEASGLIEIQRSSITISSTAKIQAISPRQSPAQAPLTEWTTDTLSQSGDPLAKALVTLQQSGGLDSALFLSIKLLAENAISGSEGVPFFVGTASIDPGDKAPFWKGLVWDPSIVPDLWNQFIQDGHVELAPPGPNTVVTSERNVVRAALGTSPTEWLTIVRVGSTDVCRGIVAVFSKISIATAVKDLEPHFFAASPSASTKNAA